LDNALDLSKFLWKKRLLLIRDNLVELNLIKEELKKNKQQLDKNKIEYFILNQNLTSNITLIGLDGLVKHQSNKLDLKKIFNLISKMPMANF
jgi:hypothetical protein